MVNREQITQRLQNIVQSKLTLANTPGLSNVGQAICQQLSQTKILGGVIRIVCDSDSRWIAHHLNEELVVRFKAGSAYGRGDREAINSRQYGEYKFEQVKNLLESKNFDSSKDCLVLFSSEDSAEVSQSEILLKAAQAIKLPTIVFADAKHGQLLSIATHSIAISSDQKLVQSIFLHAICEFFEAEYQLSKHGFAESLKASIEVDKSVLKDTKLLDLILQSKVKFDERLLGGATVFLAGNGGSTCDANILAESLRSTKNSSGQPIEAFDLHAPDTLLCAYNDNLPPFARQLVANARAGDVLIAYSTSGNSQNIVDAVNVAKQRGVISIGMLGKGGGKLAGLCDYSLIVPSDETARVQEVHYTFGQLLRPGGPVSVRAAT